MHSLTSSDDPDIQRADTLEIAEQLEEMGREAAIMAAHNAGPKLRPTGRCHYCDDIVGDDQLFCHLDCSTGWEIEQAAIRRNKGTR